MTTQEKLQHLFDAALRTLDEPLPKPATAAPEKMFAPAPWRVQEADTSVCEGEQARES